MNLMGLRGSIRATSRPGSLMQGGVYTGSWREGRGREKEWGELSTRFPYALPWFWHSWGNVPNQARSTVSQGTIPKPVSITRHFSDTF